MEFPVVLTVDQDGMYTAEAPAIPGCISSGQSKEEGWSLLRDFSVERVEIAAE
jgi:predicted RNase H-like HicB family nuclease